MKTAYRIAVAAAAAFLSPTYPAVADEPQSAPVAVPDVVIPEAATPHPVDEPMLIIPAAKLPLPVGGVILDASGVPVQNTVSMSAYRRIYKSIPFSRAEYRVNPNYRHDSTMEILTGNARHQTIIQHNHEHKQPEVRVPHPARPARTFYQPFGLGYLNSFPFYGGRIMNY